nr:zinc finger, CCHC-type [Tanacetum cinerariifolium]
MKDEELVRKLLNAVSDRYLQIVASIEQYSNLDEMTLEEAIGRLKTYEERIKYKKGKQVDDQERLMFTRHELKAKENVLENVEDLTNLEDENKTRIIVNLKEKNERLLKKIQETNLKSHITDATNLDTMHMNVQTNARIKSENTQILLKKNAGIGHKVTWGVGGIDWYCSGVNRVYVKAVRVRVLLGGKVSWGVLCGLLRFWELAGRVLGVFRTCHLVLGIKGLVNLNIQSLSLLGFSYKGV